jgi:hypothetical protein
VVYDCSSSRVIFILDELRTHCVCTVYSVLALWIFSVEEICEIACAKKTVWPSQKQVIWLSGVSSPTLFSEKRSYHISKDKGTQRNVRNRSGKISLFSLPSSHSSHSSST